MLSEAKYEKEKGGNKLEYGGVRLLYCAMHPDGTSVGRGVEATIRYDTEAAINVQAQTRPKVSAQDLRSACCSRCQRGRRTARRRKFDNPPKGAVNGAVRGDRVVCAYKVHLEHANLLTKHLDICLKSCTAPLPYVNLSHSLEPHSTRRRPAAACEYLHRTLVHVAHGTGDREQRFQLWRAPIMLVL